LAVSSINSTTYLTYCQASGSVRYVIRTSEAMVNLFFIKVDGPLDDRRGFAIQSLNSMTGAYHGNQPTPRQPTHATATNLCHGNQPTPRRPTHAMATNPRHGNQPARPRTSSTSTAHCPIAMERAATKVRSRRRAALRN
jgi:hypothetical protein